MKLKLILPYDSNEDFSNKYFITIYRNKIKNYIGLNPLNYEINIERLNSEVFINKNFEINKLDKLDKFELNTMATHEIFSQDLHNVIQNYRYFIKLNLFQIIYINWFQKKYIIQSLDFKKRIISGLIGSLIGIIGTLFFK